MYQKGDVVLVSMSDHTPDGFQTKRRPAVIVSGKVVDQAMIVPLTSSPKSIRQESVVSLKMASPEGKAAGLRLDTFVDCSVVATVPTAMIVSKTGQLPKKQWRESMSASGVNLMETLKSGTFTTSVCLATSLTKSSIIK